MEIIPVIDRNSKWLEINLILTDIQEDKVDIELSKMDGKIKQERTSSCTSNCINGACIYCTSKDPYDPEYLKKEGSMNN